MKPFRALALYVCLAITGGGISMWAADKQPDGRGDLNKEQRKLQDAQDAAEGNQPSNQSSKILGFGTGINYHGGPVMLGTTNVYYIWYGNWGSNSAQNILPDLASSVGGSGWFNINSTYYNGSNQHVANSVRYVTGYTAPTTYGSSIGDSQVQSIVADAINGGHLPSDSSGVYFVLTSAEVKETSGFCTQYCGWHTRGTIAGKDIKYSFVGNPDQCPSACSAQSTSPNGNAGADAMASIIGHELSESVTDPDLNAWYDSRGNENADKCAWNFGTEQTASNGSKYNVTFGARQYLIQQNWVNAGNGGCALKY